MDVYEVISEAMVSFVNQKCQRVFLNSSLGSMNLPKNIEPTDNFCIHFVEACYMNI